jgi:hypothetical protein
VKIKKSTPLESSRRRGSTKERYEDFFRRLRHQITKKIKPRDIADMNKHGMQEQETAAGKVIGDSLTFRALVESSDPAPWATVIKTVTPEGRRLITPVIVLTGTSL